MNCVCGVAMMPDHARRRLSPAARAGVRSHRGRGLCSACYTVAHKAGDLIDHQPRLSKADVLLEDAQILTQERGLAYRDLPAALDTTREALARAIRRACLRGDPRAIRLSHLNTYPTKGATP